MSAAYTGGCACGAIRYEIVGDPVFSNHCQCRDCQRVSGTGHGSYISFAAADVKITGDASHWELIADSGKVKRRAFCPSCGAPVYQDYPAAPGVLTIAAASLDDPSRFVPEAVTYRERALAWDHLDPGLAGFARMPPG